jgi:hypothetical protein
MKRLLPIFYIKGKELPATIAETMVKNKSDVVEGRKRHMR